MASALKLAKAAFANMGKARTLLGAAKAQADTSAALSLIGKTRSIYTYVDYDNSLGQGTADDSTNTRGASDPGWQAALLSSISGISQLNNLRNASVGGQTSHILGARLQRDLVSFNPDVVTFGAGLTNDIIIMGSIANAEKYWTACYEAARSIGAIFAFKNLPPLLWQSGQALTSQAATTAMVLDANGRLASFCAARGIPLVDLYALTVDPNNPGFYKPNWTIDGRHPIAPVSQLWGQEIVDTFRRAGILLTDRKQPRYRQDASNLFFTPVSNLNGLPINTSTRDALFRNSKPITYNGSPANVPYFVGSIGSSSGNPPVMASSIASDANYDGNIWSVTLTPNGAGTWSAQSTIGSRSLDVTRFQERAVKFQMLLGASGFGVDNTYAYLAANAGKPISGFAMNLTFRDVAGNVINSLNVQDPLDSTTSEGLASNISMRTQALLFMNGTDPGLCYDFPLAPIIVDLCVPCGAVELIISFSYKALAGASAPVTIKTGEPSLSDAGHADMLRPQIPMGSRKLRFVNYNANATLTEGQLLAIDVFRLTGSTSATLTLPSSNRIRGASPTFKNAGTATLTVAAAPGETIDGVASISVAPGESKRIHAIAANAWDQTV